MVYDDQTIIKEEEFAEDHRLPDIDNTSEEIIENDHVKDMVSVDEHKRFLDKPIF